MKTVIIGAGASGLMAAYYASKYSDTLILEKNEKAGKKIYITGKGRCNVCNACTNDEFLKNVMRNPKFLYPAISDYTTSDLIQFFEDHKCPIKIERGRRAYPVSEKASDITNTLLKAALNNGAEIKYNSIVCDIICEEGKISSVLLTNGEKIDCDNLIVATGGLSYPSTGSTGDGYKFFEKLGHKVKETSPALVPFNSNCEFIKELQGLSLKNVSLTLTEDKKVLYKELGEMLFTHFGISGPLVLSASSHVKDIKKSKISINLKPALNEEKLDKRILRDISESPNKKISHILNLLFPQRLANVIAKRANLDNNKMANALSKEERRKIIDISLNFDIPITGLRSFSEAVITRGGLDCKDFSPKTLESKIIKNLYACGEILDIDALTGGYNLFVAFSTGRLAGISSTRTEL